MNQGSYFLNDNYMFEERKKKKGNKSKQDTSNPLNFNNLIIGSLGLNPSCFRESQCKRKKMLGSLPSKELKLNGNKESLSLIQTVSRSLNRKVRRKKVKSNNEKTDPKKVKSSSKMRFMKHAFESKSLNKNIFLTHHKTKANNLTTIKEKALKPKPKFFNFHDI